VKHAHTKKKRNKYIFATVIVVYKIKHVCNPLNMNIYFFLRRFYPIPGRGLT